MRIRRRVVVTVLVCAVVGWGYGSWAAQLLGNLVRHFERIHYIECRGGWRDLGYSCDPAQFTGPYGLTLLVATGVVVLAALVALAGWAIAPIRHITATVDRFGPQNLAERTGAAGRDEVAQLGRAIDRMLDRVTEGYEAQRRFAGNASHELRTPLALQRTLIEVSMAGDPTPEQLQLLSRQLLETNQRNENLVEGLLVLAETDQGLRSRTAQRLDVIAADVVALHQDMARAAGVTVVPELEPVTVPGEAALLERLVANLVVNAIKYNDPGGRVEVRVGPRDPVLTVANDGPAVPAELVPKLFEPFRRARGERLDHGGGAGLGLTIARSIATAHDGVIEAAPRPRGGLSVSVSLPGAEGSPRPALPESSWTATGVAAEPVATDPA